MDDAKEQLTVAELVEALRDQKVRGAVLAGLFPRMPACLIGVEPDGQVTSTIAAGSAGDVFTMLLMLAQQIGAQLGCSLQWVRDPRKAPNLIVPTTGPMR